MRARLLAVLVLAAARPVAALTLEELLADVRAHHPLFRQAELSVEAEEARRHALLPQEEWLLSAGARAEQLGKASAALLSASQARSAGVHAEARRPLPSGGSLTVSASGQVLRLSGPMDGEPYAWKSAAGVAWEQPLLRGYGRRLDRAPYDLAAFDVEARRLEADEAREALLLDVSLGFVDWSLAKEQATLSERRLGLAEQLVLQTQRLRAANLVEHLDVLRAQDAARAARLQLERARADEAAGRARLAALAGRDPAELGSPVLALYAPGAAPERRLPARALRLADLPAARLREQRRLDQERRRPELTLTLRAGVAGLEEDPRGALLQVSPDASVGLELALPATRSLDAEARALDAGAAALEAGAAALRADLESREAALRARLEGLRGVLELCLRQVAAAEERTREELLLYSQGRGTLAAVLHSRDEEQEARSACAESHAAFHRLLFEYRALIDRLEASP